MLTEKRMNRFRGPIALVLACAAAAPATRPTTKPVVVLTPAEQVRFQQQTVEAQVGELQDRMFHLAELTRSAEPDDAARLLMAVRKAREDLILEQVRDVLEQLSHQDFAKAADEQQQVLVKLELLKKLLTTTDLDMQMQLEQLKKLNAAIAKLDPAIKEQRRQQKKSGELAVGKPAEGAKQEQAQNHRATEAIAQTLKDLGPAPAAAATTLGGATQDMSLAEGLLAAGNPANASPMQGQAADRMKTARDQLEKERQRILDELAKQVRKQVVENLAEMLERQKSIRGATAALAAAGLSSDQQARARALGGAESAIVRINAATLELVEQTEFSVALPTELRAVGRACTSIADRLAAGTADAKVVADERQVERELADLLDTFKQLSANPGPNPSECKGCKGNKNKLLAELKVVRLMQQHVNRHTAEVEVDRGVAALDDPTKDRITGISVSQGEVRDAAEAIHQQLSGE